MADFHEINHDILKLNNVEIFNAKSGKILFQLIKN